jgi:hypothetical protein
MYMKTKIIKSCILPVLFFTVNSLALAQETNGNAVQERVLQGVSGIKIGEATTIYLTQGTEDKIKIEAPDKYINAIKSEVNDGILTLSGKVEKATKIEITVKDLKSISLSGASELKSTNTLNVDALKAKIDGSGDLKLDVIANNLNIQIDGAGDVKIKGTAQSADFTINGAGDVKAGELVCKKCTVNISGAGEAKLNVTDEITANVSGAGSVKYKGEPQVINKNISGAGEFKKYTSDASETDTTRFKLDSLKVVITNDEDSTVNHHRHGNKNEFKAYWGGVSVGWNSYLNVNNDTKVPTGYDFLKLDQGKSIVVNVNPIEKHFSIIRDHVNIVTGLGLEMNNYRFENNYRLLPDSSVISAAYDSTLKFRKNKLVTVFLNAPLLLQFDTKQDKNGRTFHVSFGLIGGVRIGSHTKQVYSEEGVENKPKTHDDFNLSQFRYGFMARIGYGKLDLYATYAMNTMFNEYEGPQLYPISAGITLTGF